MIPPFVAQHRAERHGALPEIGSAIDTRFLAQLWSASTVDTVFLQNNGGVPADNQRAGRSPARNR